MWRTLLLSTLLGTLACVSKAPAPQGPTPHPASAAALPPQAVVNSDDATAPKATRDEAETRELRQRAKQRLVEDLNGTGERNLVCASDEDCVLVFNGCFGCGPCGSRHAVNAKWSDPDDCKTKKVVCLEKGPPDATCSPRARANCVKARCALVYGPP